MKNTVSIIIPCYNVEKYIDKFIKRILCQTYDNLELVFINDGSKDRTENFIMSYRDKIKKRGYKFVYFYQKNRGLGGAVNKGLKLMTGEFFCWCDCDNFYDDTYVEKNINAFLKNPKINIVRCDGFLCHEDNIEKPYAQFSSGNTDKFKKRLFLNSILEINFHFGCAMIRTKEFDRLCPDRDIYESRKGQNWQILLPILYYNDSYFLDEFLFTYVYTEGSITNKSISKKGLLELFNEHEIILLKTLEKMKIPGKIYYIGLIRKKYIKKRIDAAREYDDKEMLASEEKKLKDFNKMRNKIKYYSLFAKYKRI